MLTIQCTGKNVSKKVLQIPATLSFSNFQEMVNEKYGAEVKLLSGYPPRELQLAAETPIGTCLNDLDTVTVVYSSPDDSVSSTFAHNESKSAIRRPAAAAATRVSESPVQHKQLSKGSREQDYTNQTESVRDADKAYKDRVASHFGLVEDYIPEATESSPVNNPFLVSSISSEETMSGMHLSSLFEPPTELLFPGSFDEARNVALQKSLLLLVNIQEPSSFASLRLNRDIWKNPLIEQTVSANFLLIQRVTGSSDGFRYSTFYKTKRFPHVGILDPATGQMLAHLEPGQFASPQDVLAALTDVITCSGRLDQNFQHRHSNTKSVESKAGMVAPLSIEEENIQRIMKASNGGSKPQGSGHVTLTSS